MTKRRAGRIVVAMAICCCVVIGPVRSADEGTRLTLNECLARALEANPLLQAARHRIRAAEAQLDAADGTRRPRIETLALTGPVPEAEGDAVTTTTPTDDLDHVLQDLGIFYRLEIGITQPLWTFGRTDALREGAGALVDVEQARLQIAEWRVRAEVTRLFSTCLLCDRLTGLLDEVEEKLADATRRLEGFLAEGREDFSSVDRLKLAAYQAEVQVQRAEVKQMKRTAEDGLRRMVGGAGSDWKPAESAFKPAPDPVATLPELLQMAQDHPALTAVARGLDAGRAQADYRRAVGRPEIYLGGRIRYAVAENREDQESPFARDEFNLFDAGLALGLRQRWDFGITSGRARQAEAEVQALAADAEKVRELLAHRVTAAHAGLVGARETLTAATAAYKATRAWSLSELNGFKMGTTGVKDLAEALRAFTKARGAYLEAVHEHRVAIARLSAAVARDLPTGEQQGEQE